MGHSRSTTPQVVSIVFQESVHQILEKNQERVIFSMAKQDGGRPHEVQPESSLPVPPGIGAHY